MAKKSIKNGQRSFPQIKVETTDPSKIVIDANKLESHFTDDNVSISLRYYKKSCECFSDWKKDELKKFSATIDKLSKYSISQLKGHKPLCDSHKGPPAEGRFSVPDKISPDQLFHEIKVDPSNKLRVHGFFSGPVFFLVWLDREHACFPE